MIDIHTWSSNNVQINSVRHWGAYQQRESNMALDIYVMPLWRFLAGDYEMVMERSCARAGMRPPTIVTPRGILDRKRPPLDAYRMNMFKRKVRNVIERVAEFNRPAPIAWEDEGECVYAEQCHDYAMISLRTYALWLDLGAATPGLTAPPENDFFKHPLWARGDICPVTFPHLIGHDCYMSYYLPCEFKKITNVENVTLAGRATHRRAASSVRLQNELRLIEPSLTAGKGLRMLAEAQVTAIQQAHKQMTTVADLSCTHHLPIIFFG
jgi:hypothetical protein